MAGWGDNTFGYLKWGEFGDATVNVTNPNDTSWGVDNYGNFRWNGGGNLDSILSNISITAEVNVGWGARTWGYPEGGGWGNLFDVQVSPIGFGLSNTLGEETVAGEINTGYGRLTWGANAWGIAGTLQLSGIQMSANIGSVSIDNQINIGWGSDTWGYETWGISGLVVDLTGIELSSNIGSVSFNISGKAEPTGQELTITQGDAEGFASFTAEITGFSLPMVLQYQEAVVDVTGIAMSMQEGDEEATPNTIATVSATSASTWNGNFAWGYGVWGNEQITTLAMSMQEGNVDPAPDAMVTGNAAAMFVGDETVTGDANTGTITPIKWGEQTWGQSTWGNGTYLNGASYSQAATISLGTAIGDANTIASITGQLMTMQEGDEGTTANARVNVTGINLTFSVGTVYNLIWNEVNTGTTSTWTEVDTAA